MGVRPMRRSVSSGVLTALLLLPALMTASIVAGDGMPGYVLEPGEDPGEAFSSLFETRQLARVELQGGGVQTISLFLSVFSLDPGRNLTIMVPLRTLPEDVTGEPIKESDFREEYRLDRAEREIPRQDPDVANQRFWEETSSSLGLCLGSMLLTAPGEYLRENVRYEVDEYGRKEDSLDGGGTYAIDDGIAPEQHYDIDGFSIDVFGVDKGPLLEEYLEQEGLVVPEGMDLEAYEGQYLAVVEAETKPPIDEDDFELFAANAPNTTERIRERLSEQPVLSSRGIWDLKYELENDLEEEVVGFGYYYDDPDYEAKWALYGELEDIMHELIDAVYEDADFEGEVLHVDLPLDDGRMFFPLGTSAGWPNSVGDIDILFSVPEGKRLRIDDTEDAFFEGRHWYLFSMASANPGFDLASDVEDADGGRLKQANRAAWMYDNADTVGPLVAALVVVLLWFACAAAISRHYGLEGRVLRNPWLWALLGLSVLVSIAGAVLVYLLLRPEPIKELARRPSFTGAVAMWPVTLVAFLVGGLL
jgi:hypothetical protein